MVEDKSIQVQVRFSCCWAGNEEIATHTATRAILLYCRGVSVSSSQSGDLPDLKVKMIAFIQTKIFFFLFQTLYIYIHMYMYI
jgi:hypothetical protein